MRCVDVVSGRSHDRQRAASWPPPGSFSCPLSHTRPERGIATCPNHPKTVDTESRGPRRDEGRRHPQVGGRPPASGSHPGPDDAVRARRPGSMSAFAATRRRPAASWCPPPVEAGMQRDARVRACGEGDHEPTVGAAARAMPDLVDDRARGRLRPEGPNIKV